MNLHSHPELQTGKKPANAGTGRGVTAVLGPTNTGKTHLAIERMLAQPSGMIGLPLRLLAREVYQRVVERVGPEQVALVTGEEKITPKGARFQICTVEAMPEYADVHFLAIDEVQLATSLDRGHVFTDRILNLRGSHETMLLGAATIRPALEALLPGINVVTRPRMSQLHYAGQKKITRLPSRSAIVAFSADEVYAIAELIRRQRGAAAVVLGSLSPRTRNAQVDLYQSGDVDFIVATDAIGMGLNLDVDHVAFAQDQKFDGFAHRRLKPAEFGQIAGRAGRHVRDGTFGVTGNVNPFEDELIERLESHTFPAEELLQWRNRDLSFNSIEALIESLETPSTKRVLVKAPTATDQRALTAMVAQTDIRERSQASDEIRLLWQVAQIPDYRKIAPANHADLLATIYRDLIDEGCINEDWFSNQVKQCDVMAGDIDALSTRIAHIRTWTFVSHRQNWLKDAAHWQSETRSIEDRLSDALHERLTKRFVDRRTSVLMKRLRENTMLEAEIASSGAVTVEGHHVGELSGFRFTADPAADGPDAKAATAAAMKALASEIEARADRLAAAPNSDIVLDSDGTMRWVGAPVGRLVAGDEVLKPRVVLLADEQLTGPARDKVAARLDRWFGFHCETLLKPLIDLSQSEDLEGLARGVAFRLVENLGTVDRREIADDVRSLDQDQRAVLRRKGVRFGAYHIFVPTLLKPAPAGLVTLLWSLANDKADMDGSADILAGLASGRTSMEAVEGVDEINYRLAGYRLLGKKAVRVDILERLADLIRPAASWRFNPESPSERPEGAWDGGGFLVTPAMLSILGATHENMADILRGIGYRGEGKLETEIQAKLEQWDVAARAPAQPVGDDHAAPADAAETSDATPAPEASTSEAPAADDDATPAEAEEPKRLEIWRQNRDNKARSGGGHKRGGNNNRGGGGGGKGSNFDRKGGKPKHGKFNKHDNRKSKPAADKPIDPDSPFAALAALKGDLKDKK
ncbi:MAG: DEAD/DEAH box helicase [Hyphomicrobiales bacterium]|nr:DEAD/DEAH box helicase [Hyphomicrobiales bacterium]